MRAPPAASLSLMCAVRLGDECLLEDPARDARLVGDDHDGKAARG